MIARKAKITKQNQELIDGKIQQYKILKQDEYLTIKICFKEIIDKRIIQLLHNKYIESKFCLDLIDLPLDKIQNVEYLQNSIKQVPILTYFWLRFSKKIGPQFSKRILYDIVRSFPIGLKCFRFDLIFCELKNPTNFKQLARGIRALPQNIETLNLNISRNDNMGKNENNFQHFINIFENLPQNLQILKLDMLNTDFGHSVQGTKLFCEGIKKLPQGLKELHLDFQQNTLGKNTENLRYISQAMQVLPSSLRVFNLKFNFNDMGYNSDNLKYLRQGISGLPKQLKSFNIDLHRNYLNKDPKNIVYLAKGLNNLPAGLEDLELGFLVNYLHQKDLIKVMSQELKGFPVGLKSFNLDLRNNQLNQNIENFNYIADIAKLYPKSLENHKMDLRIQNTDGNVIESQVIKKYIKELPRGLKCLQIKLLDNYDIQYQQLDQFDLGLNELPQDLEKLNLQLTFKAFNNYFKMFISFLQSLHSIPKGLKCLELDLAFFLFGEFEKNNIKIKQLIVNEFLQWINDRKQFNAELIIDNKLMNGLNQQQMIEKLSKF